MFPHEMDPLDQLGSVARRAQEAGERLTGPLGPAPPHTDRLPAGLRNAVREELLGAGVRDATRHTIKLTSHVRGTQLKFRRMQECWHASATHGTSAACGRGTHHRRSHLCGRIGHWGRQNLKRQESNGHPLNTHTSIQLGSAHTAATGCMRCSGRRSRCSANVSPATSYATNTAAAPPPSCSNTRYPSSHGRCRRRPGSRRSSQCGATAVRSASSYVSARPSRAVDLSCASSAARAISHSPSPSSAVSLFPSRIAPPATTEPSLLRVLREPCCASSAGFALSAGFSPDDVESPVAGCMEPPWVDGCETPAAVFPVRRKSPLHSGVRPTAGLGSARPSDCASSGACESSSFWQLDTVALSTAGEASRPCGGVMGGGVEGGRVGTHPTGHMMHCTRRLLFGLKKPARAAQFRTPGGCSGRLLTPLHAAGRCKMPLQVSRTVPRDAWWAEGSGRDLGEGLRTAMCDCGILGNCNLQRRPERYTARRGCQWIKCSEYNCAVSVPYP